MNTLVPEEIYLQYYALHRKKLQEYPDTNFYADFDWYTLDEPAGGNFQYSRLLDFYRTITNAINSLGNCSYRLKVWDATLKGVGDNQRSHLLFEFVDPLAGLDLNLTYVIKSRFIFTIAHLSHQANRALDKKDWRDNLPKDKEINLAVAKERSSRWSAFLPLDEILRRLCRGKMFEDRNKYVHRVPSQEIIGHTWFLDREIDRNGVTYTFGDRPPLDVTLFADELRVEFDLALQAHERFKDLVREQLAALQTVTH